MTVPRNHPSVRSPQAWAHLRAAILASAHNRCEFCGAENHTLRRPARDPEPPDGLEAPPVKVVLTIAHDCRCEPACMIPGHLKALCQRCHLRLDSALHKRHASETRKRKKDAARGLLCGMEGQ